MVMPMWLGNVRGARNGGTRPVRGPKGGHDSGAQAFLPSIYEFAQMRG